MDMRKEISDMLLAGAIEYKATGEGPSADYLANDIVDALPDMIEPLVWHTREDGSMSCRGKYEISNNGSKIYPWRLTRANYPKPSYIADSGDRDALVNAANAHYRAAIMAAFGVKL